MGPNTVMTSTPHCILHREQLLPCATCAAVDAAEPNAPKRLAPDPVQFRAQAGLWPGAGNGNRGNP
jgi:hypothetical protein